MENALLGALHEPLILPLCSGNVSELLLFRNKTGPESCHKFQNRPVLGTFRRNILGTVCSRNFLEKLF